MALIRWEPSREIHSIQQEMNRLFGSYFDSPTAQAGVTGRRWIPAMDLVEEGEEYVLRADLPGVEEKDVKIELDDRVLEVSGQRSSSVEDRGEGYYRVERASGSFSRSLTLPEGIDPDAIKASFDKGVLEVRIPKPEERKPKRVSITPGSGVIEGEQPAAAQTA
jgi:HSP20 family protein